MNNREDFLNMLLEWHEDGEFDKIIDAVLDLPDDRLDDDILGVLADAYNGSGEYKKAIAVLESQRERLDGYFKWHYRMGYALFFAAEDEECDGNESLEKTILERARTEFARCMNMNPPDDCLEECDMFMERIEDALGIGDGEDENDDEFDPELYDDEELDVIEEHIKEYFGEFPTTLHEIVSPDIHVDVCIVPPTPERNYYTLLTEGMGAHIMDLPKDLSPDEYGRAELLICLPPDWRVGENDEEWFWPIGLLKGLARLPINCETWLGIAHSIDNRDPFAKNTALCGAVLRSPSDAESGAEVCELPSGEQVNFYEVIPIYREEMQFKLDNGAEALMERLAKVSHIVDINRENLCSGYIPNKKTENSVYDSIEAHLASIHEKNLDIKDICSCNHLAIFLRWFIENDLMSPLFHHRFHDIIKGVMDGSAVDLREFIITKLNGAISSFLFNSRGAQFAEYYYNHYTADGWQTYPADIDTYAERYFSWKKIDTKQFKDENYLFVPFDEQYYQAIKEIIDDRYREYMSNDINKIDLAAVKAAVEKILDCSCTSFFTNSPKAVKEAFDMEKIRGMYVGYTPMAVIYCEKNNNDSAADIILDSENEPVISLAKIPGRGELIQRIAEHLEAALHKPVMNDQTAELCGYYRKLYGTVPCIICGDIIFLPSDGGFIPLEKDKTENDLPKEKDIVDTMIKFLNCRCTTYMPSKDDTEIMRAYHSARIRGKKEGFIPLLIVPDKKLLNVMTLVSSSRSSEDECGFNLAAVSEFRKIMPAQNLDNGRIMLHKMIMKQGRKFDEIIGTITDGEPLTRFLSYWNYNTGNIKPVILAEIPVKNPWEVFAWAPPRPERPDYIELMAAAKYWYQRYGALPAVISSDTIEFFLKYPVGDDDCMELAAEIYGLCPDIADIYKTIGCLAGTARYSYVWYLRWKQ